MGPDTVKVRVRVDTVRVRVDTVRVRVRVRPPVCVPVPEAHSP